MDYNKEITNRVKRLEGQLRGILKMMDDEKDCKEVTTQLTAVRTAIDRTIGVVVSANLVDCLQKAGNPEAGNAEELMQEAIKLIVKTR